MIKPTIGYWSTKEQYLDAKALNFDHDLMPIDLQPQDATIVGVWNPSVADHSGNSRAETSVQLMQEGDSFPPSRFATWVGQARQQAQAGGMKC